MARRFTRSTRGGPKRLTDWVCTDAASGGTAYKSLAAGAAVLDQSVASDSPETLIRTHGSLNVQTDQDGADEEAFGAYGMCVVSNQAFAIGVTAIPTPYTDADSDLWFVHGYWYAPVRFGTAVGFQNVSQTFSFDSKAMRRVSPDETIVIVLENGSGANGIVYSYNFGMLFKHG